MKFILLFGPPAVGKMSVGQELEKLSGLQLFHNHMTIELVVPFFDFGSPAFEKLVASFRQQIFEEVAASDLAGMIFTFVWAFDLESEEKYVSKIVKIFEDQGADIYYVELEADLDERLKRNTTSNRLEHKPTKRDVESSEKRLLEHERKHRFNTIENEFHRENYVKINNTDMSPKDVAKKIMSEFSLGE